MAIGLTAPEAAYRLKIGKKDRPLRGATPGRAVGFDCLTSPQSEKDIITQGGDPHELSGEGVIRA